MRKKYKPADISEQFKQGVNLGALVLDTVRGFADFRLGDFSPLSVPFDGYWDKNFTELPIRLQAEVDKVYDSNIPQLSEYKGFGTKVFFDLEDPKVQRVIRDAGRDLWWDLQSPEQRRRKISEWDSLHYPETSAEEFIWMAEQKVKQRKLQVEIKRWEEMNTQGVPSEEKIKNEMLDKLHAELTELEKNHTPFVGFMEQGDPDTVMDTNSKAGAKPPTTPAVTTHKIQTRVKPLDAEIKIAKGRALDKTNTQSVWDELVKMADKQEGCLLGQGNLDEIKYGSSADTKIFMKRRLGDRLNR